MRETKIVIECKSKEMADFIVNLSQSDKHIDEKIASIFEEINKKSTKITQI